MKKKIFFAVSALLLLTMVLGAFWIGGIIMSRAGSDSPSAGAPVDYVLILGCRLEGATAGRCLEERIQIAVDFLTEHPSAIAVCSGGQGSDETIPEAEAIAAALMENGIPKTRILLEDTSRSTFENLTNTKQILDQHAQGRAYRVAIATNNFHIYRARRLANYVGFIDPVMLSAKTPTTLFYQNLLREICSVILSWIRFR